MSRADNALARVQNLYVMQSKLLHLLESDLDLSNPDVRREVRGSMKEFEELLSKADWRYMGGMDVWETLKNLPAEMSQKLKASATTLPKRRLKAAVASKRAVVKAKKAKPTKKKRK